MDFVYYIVRKKDMTILDGAKDMVSAINMGLQQGCACLILQACVITEVGQDPVVNMPVTEEVDTESTETIDSFENSVDDEELEIDDE